MMRAALFIIAAASGAAAEGVPVPSGQPVTRIEIIEEATAEAVVLRYRFLAPEAATLDFEIRLNDMAYLCESVAVPELRGPGLEPRRVVVSLSEKPVDFGARDAGVAQFFESYTVVDGRCIWEAF